MRNKLQLPILEEALLLIVRDRALFTLCEPPTPRGILSGGTPPPPFRSNSVLPPRNFTTLSFLWIRAQLQQVVRRHTACNHPL
jgi:hypothetical protein